MKGCARISYFWVRGENTGVATTPLTISEASSLQNFLLPNGKPWTPPQAPRHPRDRCSQPQSLNLLHQVHMSLRLVITIRRQHCLFSSFFVRATVTTFFLLVLSSPSSRGNLKHCYRNTLLESIKKNPLI